MPSMGPVNASYENGSLRLEKALPLRAGERVTVTVVRWPDPTRWDLARLAATARDDLPLAEAGLEDWVTALDREDRD